MDIFNIILGSQSRQRARILSYFCLPFTQCNPSFDEKLISKKFHPEEYVILLSQKKSESLRSNYPNALILTADTVVYQNGLIFNKPENEEEALVMLCQLMNQEHYVYTGLTLSHNNTHFSGYETTKIAFHNNISIEHLKNYIKTFQTLDKCGAYSIQNGGSIIIKEMQGCYYNAQGLPINLINKLFSQFGINLWDFISS